MLFGNIQSASDVPTPVALRYTLNWVFLLPGTAQTSLRRLRPVPPDRCPFSQQHGRGIRRGYIDERIVAAAVGANGSASLRKIWMSGYSSERRSSFH
jgi:hypothetical protein